MGNRTLGLDLGANSIGWALVDTDENKILAAGVRVFPEGVDNFDTKKEKSKSEARRIARGMRRQIARRSRRKRKLREALVKAKLLPADPAEQQRLEGLDPYHLRRRALDEPLAPYELGRVLIHLNQRRGFLSNRKTDRERKAETKGMLAEISALEGKIKAANCRTLGEYLCQKAETLDHRNRAEDDHVRHRHTLRAMYECEFNAIWDAQQRKNSLLTDELRGRIHRMIFFQRKMYWPASVVGRCELEPTQKRCPRADRLAQWFRLLQEVNNLRYVDPATGDDCRLDEQQRTLLIDKLAQKKELSFNDIRKTLNFSENVTFNLERGKRTKLLGMVTDATLAAKGLFGPAWYKRPETQRDEIVRTLIHADDDEIRRRAISDWGVSPDVAEALVDVDLPSEYLGLSRMALEKLLPHMRHGLLYMTDDDTPSALSEAGYLRRDQIMRPQLDCLPKPPEVTNSVVRQALHEVRKVVNAIIREYGKPDRIHIELARNAKATSEERKRIGEAMREREAVRDDAANKIREHGVKVTRDAIDRYLLWKEQRETCPYSGKPISIAQLLSGTGEIDIDHILPYSRCLDDSMANKVVCFRTANHDKGQETPHEWLAARQPAEFEQLKQHVASLPYNKRKRFTQKTLELDDFIQRQLNDTRYISRAVLEYVRCLVADPHHALCVKGEQTATLRRHWGLNSVLRHDDLDIKNRDDHRHHAVDAIAIALTDQKRLQQLAEMNRRGGEDVTGEIMLDPWDKFRDQVIEVTNRIVVSFRTQRRIAGALHKDFMYGATVKPRSATIDRPWAKTWTEDATTYVRRKKIEELDSTKHIAKVRDSAIRKTLEEYLRVRGIDPSLPQKFSPTVWKDGPTMASGIPIKKVRLLEKGESYHSIRTHTYVELGSNHHMEIVELLNENGDPILNRDGTPQCEGILVSMVEAAERIRDAQRALRTRRQELSHLTLSASKLERSIQVTKRETAERFPVIQRNHGPTRRFIMSLSINDVILLELDNGSTMPHRVQKMSEGSIILRPHTYAGKVSDYDKPPLIQRRTPNTLRGRKVTVDPLGRIRWAND
ncbi:MAG: type II CRISPR RNA-guided endonuclease Cas9 [Planctomycetota bacterium]|nr:MAG: type II CRISPR RNA-guided endonuclease Cas9 [Planctomycetota bacterium]